MLGGWTFAFKDYIDLNITAYVDDPIMQQMANIVDPYGQYTLTHSVPLTHFSLDLSYSFGSLQLVLGLYNFKT